MTVDFGTKFQTLQTYLFTPQKVIQYFFSVLKNAFIQFYAKCTGFGTSFMQGTLATIRIPDRSCFHIILYISCKDALHFWQISIVNLIILGAKNTALC
jgi:hypothetical protein